MKNQFITDSQGEKIAVILPIKEYKKIIEDLEDAEDVKLYDEAKALKGKNVSFNDYLKKRQSKK